MAKPASRLNLFTDLSFQAFIFEPLPIPLKQEPVGLKLVRGDGKIVVVVNHDPKWHPRTMDKTLDMTNETFPVWEYIDGKVVPGKAILKLQKRLPWIIRCIEIMGIKVWKRFITPGTGFCDTTADGVDPYTGDIKLGIIDCGGNRRLVLNDLGLYWEVDAQDYYSSPNSNLDYNNAPHLHEVKTLIGNTLKIPWFVKPDPKDGDTIWPFLKKERIVHEKKNCTRYPELPLFTTYHGYPVKITQYVFRGSNTYGWIEDSDPVEDGWYVIEEMTYPDPPDTSYQANDRSWVVHIDEKDWTGQCPPPIDNWTRQETLWDKILSLF